MARYLIHFRDSIDEVLDPEGVEISVEAVREVALIDARDCMAADAWSGRLICATTSMPQTKARASCRASLSPMLLKLSLFLTQKSRSPPAAPFSGNPPLRAYPTLGM
jgi:hypothetical protein